MAFGSIDRSPIQERQTGLSVKHGSLSSAVFQNYCLGNIYAWLV